MRVVTLLPAATEIVAALGGAEYLVGISHECDYPPSVQWLPRVTATPVDSRMSGAAIDADVRRLSASGKPVIGIDAGQLQALRPDLIITQGLCDVCAVSDGQVYRLAGSMASAPEVLSLVGRNLDGIWSDIYAVGAALELGDEAEELVLGLESRLQRLRSQRHGARARVACIEWLDPLYVAGHWVPELVEAAGGEDVGARPGSHSFRREWRDLHRLEPDCLIVMLCGFGVERIRRELSTLEDPEGLELMSRVPTWIIDGNSFTSRAGPRVVDGARLIHSAIGDQPWAGKIEKWAPPVQSSLS
ncbi:MAG: ABC transporter substrate-binding protein [Gemmatimonadales bacterium]